MDTQAILFIIILGSMYGVAAVASRFGIGQFDPVTFSALRFLLAAAIYSFAFLFNIQGKTWPKNRQLWRNTAVSGIIGNAIPTTLLIYSLKYISSGLSSVLATLCPVITAILAHFLVSDESLNWRKTIGIIMSLSGAMLIVILGETGLINSQPANFAGYIMIFCAVIFQGLNGIYMRKYLTQFTAFDVAGLRLIWASIVIVPVAFGLERFDLSRVKESGVTVLLLCAIIVVVSFFMFFYGINRFGVSKTSTVDYVQSAVATLGGAWLLHEIITPGMLIGMVLILTGVVIINLKRKKIIIKSFIRLS